MFFLHFLFYEWNEKLDEQNKRNIYDLFSFKDYQLLNILCVFFVLHFDKFFETITKKCVIKLQK